jgi:hypothetical protein
MSMVAAISTQWSEHEKNILQFSVKSVRAAVKQETKKRNESGSLWHLQLHP